MHLNYKIRIVLLSFEEVENKMKENFLFNLRVKMFRNKLQNKKLEISESITEFRVDILYLISETNPLMPETDKIEIILEVLLSDYYNVVSVMNNVTLNYLKRNSRKVEYSKSVSSTIELKQKFEFRENNTNFWNKRENNNYNTNFNNRIKEREK